MCLIVDEHLGLCYDYPDSIVLDVWLFRIRFDLTFSDEISCMIVIFLFELSNE